MFFKYVTGQQLSVLLRAVQEIAVRAVLPPSSLAVWNLITIIGNTFTLFQMNVVAASNRLLAQLEGANSPQQAKKSVRGGAVFMELSQQTVLTLFLLLTAPLFWENPAGFTFSIFPCAAAVMANNALIAILTGLLEASGNFSRLGVILPVNALLQAVIVIGCSEIFGEDGLVFGSIAGLILNLMYYFGSLRLARIAWLCRPSLAIIRRLGGTAVWFRLSDLPTVLFYMLDAMLASFWLGLSDLAMYMTARVLINFTSQAVFAANRISLVRLGNRVGAEQSKEKISEFLTSQFALVFLVLMPLSVAIFEPLMRWGIPLFLPKYTDALFCVPYLMLANLASARVLFIRNYWIQMQKWREITLSGCVGTFCAVVVYALGRSILGHIGIEELALLTFLGQLPYAFTVIFSVSASLNVKLHLVFRASIFILSMVSIGVCLYINGSFANLYISSIMDLARNLGLSVIVSIPAVLIGWWIYKAMQDSFPVFVSDQRP